MSSVIYEIDWQQVVLKLSGLLLYIDISWKRLESVWLEGCMLLNFTEKEKNV